MLKIRQSATLEDLIKKLGRDVGAEPKQHLKKSLTVLIEYLKFAELIKEEDGKYFLIETKDIIGKTSKEDSGEEEIVTQTAQADFFHVTSKITSNILFGIIITPETDKDKLRKTVRIVLDEIKRWCEENEEKT